MHALTKAPRISAPFSECNPPLSECKSSVKGKEYEGTFSDAPSQIPTVHGSGNWSCPYSCPSCTLLPWSGESRFTDAALPTLSSQTRVQKGKFMTENEELSIIASKVAGVKSEKERNLNKFAVWHHAILWLRNVKISSCLQIPRVSKIMFSKILLFQRNTISIKRVSMYFLVECWLSKNE